MNISFQKIVWGEYTGDQVYYLFNIDIMFGQIRDDNRPKGHLRLRYKDAVMIDLKKTDIEFETLESIADNRSMWGGIMLWRCEKSRRRQAPSS